MANASFAADKIGIVLLHGKQGTPLGQSGIVSNKQPIGARLVSDLKDAGYLVATPELCWSGRRDFDKTLEACLAEIDDAVAGLKSRGATAIVVAGQSLGGNATLAYGAQHPELLGLIGMAPADDPTLKMQRPEIQAALAKAQQLVDEGKGDQKATFDDVNTGPNGIFAMTVTTTPNIYLNFYGPHSAAIIPTNAAQIKIPVLWLAGDDDPTQKGGPGFAFDKIPANPLNRYATVHATHLQTPDAGRQAILVWLKELAAAH